MSELTGKIRMIKDAKTYGEKGFRKREMAITTEDKFPQNILVEFTQDNCDALDNFKVGDDVKIQINIGGRIWVNPEKEEVYFNSITGWRIENLNNTSFDKSKTSGATSQDADNQDLPF